MATINGVKVSITDLQNTKSTLEECNTSIIGELNHVKATMEALRGTEVYSSEGATTIKNKFDTLCPKFDKIHSVIEEYTIFLGNTIKDYEGTESAVVTQAKNVKDWD